MREIRHLLLASRRLDLLREVRQRRLEHIVVVIMNRDGVAWLDDLHQLYAILSVHRHLEHAEDTSAAQMQQSQVDAREALRDVLEVVVNQSVPADVHAVARCGHVRPEIKHRAHDAWQQRLHAVLAVPPGHGGDAQPRPALVDLDCIPLRQSVWMQKAWPSRSQKTFRAS